MKKMIEDLIEAYRDWKEERAFRKRLKVQQKRDPYLYK
tara:strand:- start:854 stop:967 length:114 start_codon:yes stop_codon:yes gene_type:complete